MRESQKSQYRDFAIFNTSIIIYMILNVASFELLTSVKFIVGIIGLLLYPGFVITDQIHKDSSIYTKIGFSILWGYIFQIILISAEYLIFEISRIVIFPWLFMSVFTLIFFNLYWLRNKTTEIKIEITSLFNNTRLKILLGFFVTGIILRILMNLIVGNIILPDGALYWDFSRNAVETGRFFSTTINDSTTPDFLSQVQVSSIAHIFTSFGIIIMMSLSNTSYLCAKMAVLIPSLFIAFPIYEIARKISDRRTAMFAFILSMIYPIFTYFSALLHGPEINAAAIITIIFLLVLEANKPIDFLKIGVLLGIAEGFWFPITYVFMSMIPIIWIIYNKMSLVQNLVKIFIAEFFVGTFVLLMLITSKNFYFALVANIFSMILIGFIIRKSQDFIINILLMSAVSIWSKIIQSIGPTADIIFNSIHVEIIKKTIIENTFNPVPNVTIRFLEAFISLFYIFVMNAGIIIFVLSMIIIAYYQKRNIGKIFSFIIFVGLLSFTAYLSRDPWMYSTAFIYDIGRYFIFLTVIVVISAAKYLSIKIRKRNVISIILVGLILISIGFAYYNRIGYVLQKDPVKNYGWNNMVPWVIENTEENQKFFVVQDREFTFYTNRVGVGIIDRYLVNQTMMNISRLINATKIYRPDYIVLDTVFNLSFPYLRELYNYNQTIGNKIGLNATGIFEDLTNAEIIFELVFVDNPSYLTKVYRIIYLT